MKLKKNQTRLNLCNRLVVLLHRGKTAGPSSQHTRGCSFVSADMKVPPEGSRNANSTYRRGNGDVGKTLVSQISPCFYPCGPHAHPPAPHCCQVAQGAAGNAGPQQHRQERGITLSSVHCWQIQSSTTSGGHAVMCRDPRLVQGCSGPRWPGLRGCWSCWAVKGPFHRAHRESSCSCFLTCSCT